MTRLLPIILLVALALMGCREEEQGRTIGFEKGVYAGASMPAIDDETRAALRERLHHQDY